MTPCRIPEFCERYRVEIGIYDLKCKRILPMIVNERNICLNFHKHHNIVNWKKKKR